MERNKGKETKETVVGNEKNIAPKNSVFFRIKRLIKAMVILLLLLGLIVGGFFLGVYLRVFDVNVINEKLGLYQYPILSDYFVKPDEVETEEVPATESAATIQDEAKRETEKIKEEQKAALQAATTTKSVILTKEEIDQQIKQSQAEEKKRIAKLARLYGQMKPEEAVEILNNLNNEMIIEILGKMDEAQVSKLLVKFDADRSAQLTQSMYNGKPKTINQVR